jgi:hypothetical protein
VHPGGLPQPSTTPAAAKPGSSLLSYSMAEELVQQVGGSIQAVYPVSVAEPSTGTVSRGTKVEVRLPGPGTTSTDQGHTSQGHTSHQGHISSGKPTAVSGSRLQSRPLAAKA